MKQWEELIREECVQVLGGHRGPVLLRLSCSYLSCVVAEGTINLAYFFCQKNARFLGQCYYQPQSSIWPCFLTRLFDTVLERILILTMTPMTLLREYVPLALKTYSTTSKLVIRGKACITSLFLHPLIIIAFMSSPSSDDDDDDVRNSEQVYQSTTIYITLFIHSTTKTTIYLPLPSKPMKLSLHGKPPYQPNATNA
ncbi:hypothetical protein Tco_0466236 [Tanacetum coccineum]